MLPSILQVRPVNLKGTNQILRFIVIGNFQHFIPFYSAYLIGGNKVCLAGRQSYGLRT